MAGAYCMFCGRRCFVYRVLPDGSWSGHLATCAAGMEHDRQVCGHDHTTAINPHNVPAAGPAPTGHLPHPDRYTLGGFAVPVALPRDSQQPIPPQPLPGGDVAHAFPPLGDPCEICAGRPAAPCHVEPADPCHPDVMTLCASCALDTAAEETSDDAKPAKGAVHVIEGFVIGHARCSYKEGCTEPSERVVDPLRREVYGDTVEIDICQTHLRELCDDI